jgi:phosphoribosylaminoimidazole carboxylase (NCAIR synthetase)
VLTVESECVNISSLKELNGRGHLVLPKPSILVVLSDKLEQLKYFESKGFQVPEYMDVPNLTAAEEAGTLLGFPYILRSRRAHSTLPNYQYVTNSLEVASAFEKLNLSYGTVAEKVVAFSKVLAVVVVQSKNGLECFPVAEVNAKDGIVIAPAQISIIAQQEAVSLAKKIVASFDSCGVYTVKVFMLSDDSILFHSLIPR